MTTTASSTEISVRLKDLYEQGRYRETVQAAEALPEAGTGANIALGSALLFAGCAQRELNELAAAESRILSALGLLSNAQGPPSSAYLRGMQELAGLYELMGRYAQSESLLRRALDQHGREDVN